jgi:hypothetical protein
MVTGTATEVQRDPGHPLEIWSWESSVRSGPACSEPARAGKESAVAWEATVAGQSATIAEAAAAIRTAEPVIAIVARSRRSSDFWPPFWLVWPERTGAGCTTASRTTT